MKIGESEKGNGKSERERERERERNLPSPGGCNLLPSSLPSTSASSSPNLLIPREEGGRDELKRKRSEGRCALRADAEEEAQSSETEDVDLVFLSDARALIFFPPLPSLTWHRMT